MSVGSLYCSGQKHTVVEGTVSKDLNDEEQWLYWLAVSNGYDIIDSCKIDIGMEKFKLKGVINEENLQLHWLTFSLKGPSMAVIRVAPGDSIKVFLDKKTFVVPVTENSPATEEEYNKMQCYGNVNAKISTLEDSYL